MIRLLAAVFAALWMLTVPALAQDSLVDRCAAETCTARLTAAELLQEAQTLVSQKRYAEAKPMLAALAHVPEFRLQTRFLTGFIASESGDFAQAEHLFRAILSEDPGQTRVRLELARVLRAEGRETSADHQYKMASQDPDLPPDIARIIRTERNVIRSRRTWSADFDIGIAPDSNINNATSAGTVNVLFGPIALPFTLSPNARATSGTGITGSFNGSLRLPAFKSTPLLIDLDAAGNNYKGSDYDDYSAQIAVGPEFRLSDVTKLSVQGVGARRWYGGQVVTTQVGARTGFETVLSPVQRLGMQIDVRHSAVPFDHGYSGWNLAGSLTYERAVTRSIITSHSIFLRRDQLNEAAYSSWEAGIGFGVGGELPKGFNVGLGATLSRAWYDAPMLAFSLDPRRDWRVGARASIGNRAIRVLGFSPQISWSWNKNRSTLPIYATERSRVRFTLARYF